jgi:hypothetical protein
MATAQELGVMATEVVAAKVAFDAALDAFVNKNVETAALVMAEQTAVDAANIALDDAISTAHETVGWAAANAAFLSTKEALDVLNVALAALVPTYQQL